MADETRAIESALTADEWQIVRFERAFERGPQLHAIAGAFMAGLLAEENAGIGRTTTERLVAGMALANAALRDGDPRKITRGRVNALREMVSQASPAFTEDLETLEAARSMIDALTALLSPEE